MNYEILKIKEEELGDLLHEGWEPFSATVEHSSYYFMNTTARKREQQITSQTYIHLRKDRLVL